MNKSEFKKAIRQNLKDFNYDEVERIIEYYDELIAEKLESGLSEEKVIASFGNVKVITDDIKANLVLERSEHKTNNILKNFIIILGICTSPLLIGLAAVFIAIFVTIISVLLALLVTFIATSFAIMVYAIAFIINSIFNNFDFPIIIISLGAALFSSSILMIFGMYTLKFGKQLLHRINKVFARLIKKNRTKEGIKIV